MQHNSKSARDRAELQQLLENQLRMNIQLTRTIWTICNLSPSKEITIDEESLDALYDLKYSKPDAARPSLVTIKAAKLPDPTEKQLIELGERLLGCSVHPGEDMTAVGLSDYPFSFISRAIAPYVILHEGKWIARAEYDAIPKPPAPQP